MRALNFLAASVLLAGAAAPAHAQTIAITGARILTGTGSTLDNATVLVRDGRIAAVGRDVTVPAGATVIDGQGKVVTPGLINSYTTIGIVEIEAVDETNDAASGNDQITAAFDVRYGLNPYSTLIPIERDGGVTSAVVAPGARASIIAGMGALIHLAGTTADAMLDRSPVAMFGILNEGAARRTGGARGTAVLRLRELLEDVKVYAANPAAYENRDRRDLSL
ncbi:MAG TPA: hypothetical protein VFL88_09705, partial [Gemmatimonadales bacterium]|nr:hypothetical protein [Gemmatimonadales bacterium]